MEYFKYTLQFLNTITFTSSTFAELDNYLNGVVKGYLNHNFGFLPIAPTEDELDELANEIGASYDLMLNDIKPRYEEVLRLGTVHTFRSKDTTDSVYGDEERTGKYYEPVVSSAQASVKTNGELTTWEDDKVTLSREEDRVLSESAIKDFFKEIKEEVELYFIDFVNIYADGTGCQKPYTLEQLEAINSGITKSKVEQIQTNKENIDLLVDAVAGITDALDDKQDKLNATQLDAVNSGIDATKVAQIETNKNNIAQLSNPNLLINGDFKVNQRGFSTTSSASTYTVDRWQNNNTNATITLNTDGSINLKRIGAIQGYFIQILNPTEENLWGKTCTMSCKFSDGYILSKSFSFPASYSSGGNLGTSDTYQNVDLRMFLYNANKVGFTFDIKENADANIVWAKLEIGEISTPFSPRPYAEELEMCKRYFLKLSGTTATQPFATTFAYSATNVGAILFHKLRTSPTLSYPDSGLQYRAQSGTQIATTISVDGFTSQCLNLRMTTTGATSGESGLLRTRANGDYIALDAEIY